MCSGLNSSLLHEWVRVLTADADTMSKFYEAWAFVRQKGDGEHAQVRASQPHILSVPESIHPMCIRPSALLPCTATQMLPSSTPAPVYSCHMHSHSPFILLPHALLSCPYALSTPSCR